LSLSSLLFDSVRSNAQHERKRKAVGEAKTTFRIFVVVVDGDDVVHVLPMQLMRPMPSRLYWNVEPSATKNPVATMERKTSTMIDTLFVLQRFTFPPSMQTEGNNNL